jgi:hypothetical protein
MQPRKLLAVAGGLALLGMFSAYGERASAQNQAPFTIRKPPEGATVREKVRVEIPLASIPEGGYIAYYIDGQFRVALAPTQEQRDKAKPGQPYVFVWDTKAPYRARFSTKDEIPADGEHEIAAKLYAPDPAKGSVLKESSSVKITVQNKFDPGNAPITLRYRFVDGSSRDYNRTGDTSIVAGLTQGAGGTDNQELVAENSDLLVAVEDKYPNGNAIVRNLLKTLTVRQGGQETTYPSEQLPKALYQEVDPYGDVKYQNETVSFDQFAQMGIPVSATLELPVLPRQPVAVGDKWQTSNVSLELPGTPPDKQPHVTVDSSFDGVEWQGGYPTAKIHQHYDGSRGLKLKNILVDNIDVMDPQITLDQDIYIAYRSGTLVKIVRSLDITGKTLQQVTPGAGGAGMTPGGMPGMGMGMPGMMAPGGGMPGMMSGGPGMGGGMPGGYMQMMQRGGGGGGSPYGGRGRGMNMGGMGRGGGRRGGMMSGGSGMGGSYMQAMQRMNSGRGMGGPGMMSSGGPGMSGGMAGPGAGAVGQQPTQITLKSTTTTELKR